MSTTLLNKDLGSRRLPMLVDMRKPLSLRDLAIEGRPHVEKRKMSFAAESVAVEDRGEDRGSIDLPQFSGTLIRCDHFLAIPKGAATDQESISD